MSNCKSLSVNDQEYQVIELLGKGKSGYSYLVEKAGKRYVLKQIHHEPCDYYQFGNKLEAELNAYAFLKEAGINIPQLFAVDEKQERILKEYIQGDLISQLVEAGKMQEDYLDQVTAMTRVLYPKGVNIDYYPTNFIVCDQKLYYIDYEINPYSEEWNFENWGIQYWK